MLWLQWVPAAAEGAAQPGGLCEPALQPAAPAHQQGGHPPHRSGGQIPIKKVQKIGHGNFLEIICTDSYHFPPIVSSGRGKGHLRQRRRNLFS